MKPGLIYITIVCLIPLTGGAQDISDREITAKAWTELQSLAGKWQVRGLRNFEEWSVESDTTLTGEGYALAPGAERRTLESLRLIRHRDGSIDYEATVVNQNAGATVPFHMTAFDNRCWTFENPSHDFPQKIRYCILGEDTLQARVSGATRSFDMELERVEE